MVVNGVMFENIFSKYVNSNEQLHHIVAVGCSPWIFDADPWCTLQEYTCFKVAVGNNLLHDKVFNATMLSKRLHKVPI